MSVLEFDRIRGTAVEENFASFLRSLKDPDILFSLPGAVILKDSRTTRAACVEIEIAGGRKKFHVKRLNNKGFLYTLRYFLARSRAKRLFYTSLEAAERGVSLPRPVAYLEERFLRVLKRSFFISEFVEEAAILPEVWKQAVTRTGRLALIQSLADFVADLHRRGYYQGDMKTSNILVGRDSGGFSFFVTDLDGARLFPDVGRRHRVHDLARLSASMLLAASATDRHRFLRRYLASSGISDREILSFSRDAAAKSTAIVRKQIGKKKYSKEVEESLRKFLGLYPVRW